MNGEEFLLAIDEKHSYLKTIPVVVASANGSFPRSHLLGREVLKKPINLNDIYRIAEQYY